MIKATLKTAPSIEVCFSSASTPYQNERAQREHCPLAPPGRFILVIDNSPTIQRVVEMTLQHEGYDIRSFHDGIAAMRWFAGPESRTPDLMLVELDLPKLGGFDVIKKFKAKSRFANTACILLSQQENTAHNLKEDKAGRIASLRKPFTTQELVVAVHTVCHHPLMGRTKLA